jgi:hypothetical protein
MTNSKTKTKTYVYNCIFCQYKFRIMLRDKQIELLTCNLELVLRKQSHRKPLNKTKALDKTIKGKI